MKLEGSGFGPNKTPEEVAEADRQRGMADHGAARQEDDPVNKVPWWVSTPVNKAEDATMKSVTQQATDLLKGCKNIPDGEDLEKNGCPHHHPNECPSECDMLEKRNPSTGAPISVPSGGAGVPTPPPPPPPSSGGSLSMSATTKAYGSGYGSGGEAMNGEEDGAAEVGKALNSRSMHIPRPHQPYDPFNVWKNATRPVTRRFSALQGPEGVAPLVGDTLQNVAETEHVRTHRVYKSCATHGIQYREEVGCAPCHEFNKSMCKGCGKPMHKTVGGTLACSVC